ncbi:hypothetical protein [Geodermatophilus poikilotrophus]|uniref:hypothetical protein n=1 Tax=Geodermatophilus poikilotrophus TaxID=1333667 RepID=UPI001587C624|nr:hypothetical protein [Geodermatophilus poikilotrophus]
MTSGLQRGLVPTIRAGGNVSSSFRTSRTCRSLTSRWCAICFGPQDWSSGGHVVSSAMT